MLFILLYSCYRDMLTVGVLVPVLLLNTTWSFAVVILIFFCAMVVFVQVTSFVVLLFLFVGFAFLVLFISDFVMLAVEI